MKWGGGSGADHSEGTFPCSRQCKMKFVFASLHFDLEASAKSCVEQHQRRLREILLSPARRARFYHKLYGSPMPFQSVVVLRKTVRLTFSIVKNKITCVSRSLDWFLFRALHKKSVAAQYRRPLRETAFAFPPPAVLS